MIQLTNGLIREYLATLKVTPTPDRLHVLGIRGAVPVGEAGIRLVANTLDRFDDALGLFGTVLRFWPGTVEPGLHYTKHPLHPDGAAHLLPLEEGGKPVRYELGFHRGKPGLRQIGGANIRRDKDRDGVAEPHEPRTDNALIGANLHRMGHGERVGPHSAGCSGHREPDYLEFYGECVKSGQKQFLYYVIDGQRFARWFDHERKYWS